MKGGSRLTHAQLSEAPKSLYADRPNCLDLVVVVPQSRTYMVALEDERAIPRWKEVIERHAKFCEYFPAEVRDPKGPLTR